MSSLQFYCRFVVENTTKYQKHIIRDFGDGYNIVLI
eukprot:UN16673